MRLLSGTSGIKTSTRGTIQPVTLSILGDQVLAVTGLFQAPGFSQVKKHLHPAFQVCPLLNLNLLANIFCSALFYDYSHTE